MTSPLDDKRDPIVRLLLRYKYTLSYIALVATVMLIIDIVEYTS